MVIRELLKCGGEILEKSEVQAPRLDASLLLCHVLGQKNRSYLIMNYAEEVCRDDEEKYMSLIAERALGKPTAYIVGTKEFMSLEFEVDENVLIPRGDTETLCECIIDKNTLDKPKLADICCGSGCIGISLAFYTGAVVDMFDISEEAVRIANKNACRIGVGERCGAEKADILREIPLEKYDIVVSNPPYIETDEIPYLMRDVAEYEPRLALDGGDDGLMFYRRLAGIAPEMLNDGGILALEVGHTQAEAVADMLRESFCDIETVCDLAGIKRVVFAKKM